MQRALSTIAVLAAFLVPAVAGAQTGSLTGVITRQSDGSALSGVQVSIVGTGYVTVSGPDGRYTLSRLPTGQHTLQARLLGYRPVEQSVSVTSGGVATVNISMESAPIMLGVRLRP